ncbi:MAG: protein-methionine-sulfoxide reductase catalytic subunit MsrP, partial [Phycisphaerales bacterium]|nr:protein-methionine-sulfoxide reductase catalytic subunit MsrP [Phycisphaerales bacterium]
HNNFYEFLPGRGGPVWEYTDKFEVSPWTITIDGECAKPMTIDLDDLHAFPHEERLYHFRCVERWAMNIPWLGFPLRTLLEKVEPKSSARYVRFVSKADKATMPGLKESYYPWPYHEALRIDEAMHDLAFLVTGVYGEPLPKQHGAPVRLAVPWKYGYKNPKSIVRIELTSAKPPTFWSAGVYGHEYGFISNVNPNIPHPRWSQAESYWLDTRDRFKTPIFNGYDAMVGSMYPDEPRTLQKPLVRGETAR